MKVAKQRIKKKISKLTRYNNCNRENYSLFLLEKKDMKNKALFIKTQDESSAKQLEDSGFKLVDYTNGTWTFMNNPECLLTFDNNKIVYSNVLHF